MLRLLLLAAIVTAWPSSSSAYRPFDTTDASVSDPWQLTIEAAPLSMIYAPTRRLAAPTLVLSQGLPGRLELGLGARLMVSLERAAGGSPRVQLVDGAAVFKFVALDGTLQHQTVFKKPSLAGELHLLLPVTDSDERVGFFAVAALSHVGSWGAVHVNGGGGLSRAGNGYGWAGVAYEGPWSWPLRPVLEVNASFERGVGVTPVVIGGTILPVNANLWLDIAVRYRRDPQSATSTLEVTTGINWALPHFHGKPVTYP